MRTTTIEFPPNGSSAIFLAGFAVAMSLGLTGCANQFATAYQPAPTLGAGANRRTPNVNRPQVILTSSVHTDLPRFLQQGYVIVGHSSFNSTSWEPRSMWLSDAVDQAVAVGADLVLYKTRDIGPTTETFQSSGSVGVTSGYLGPTSGSPPVTFEEENFRYIAVYLRKSGGG
jgi:hypothetical protein